ncbi:MAG: MFS transporter [Lentisphaeria bacterium]|nr:MFS transporter [Lentisphaeria bacterium]
MKYLFYLLPGLLNVVMGLFFFITAKRMADAGLSSLAVTATMPMWALVYAATSFIIGKFANKNNAVKILLISQFILLGSVVGLLITPSVKLQYFYLIGSGLGTGLFFTPFQVIVKLFEKVEISAETFARSAATYTFSWSFGQGCGPMIAAMVWGAFDPVNGWKYCYMITIAIVILVMISLIFMQKFIAGRLREESQTTPDAGQCQSNALQLPDLMKATWVLAIGGYLVIAAIRVYLPDYATKIIALPTSTQGLILALVSIVQALVALACWKVRKFPFRPWGGLATAGGAIASLLIFAFCSSGTAYMLAAVLLGCFSGIYCFNMTYHALANYTKSARYAAGNETIVGGMSVFAPIAAGVISDASTARMPFYVLAAILIITAIFYCRMTWKYRKF